MVEFLTYQGEKYPFRINYYAINMAQKELGLTLTELDESLDAQQTVLWYALQAGHHIAKKEFNLKKEDMIWMLDEDYFTYQKAMFEYAKQLVEVQEDVLRKKV